MPNYFNDPFVCFFNKINENTFFIAIQDKIQDLINYYHDKFYIINITQKTLLSSNMNDLSNQSCSNFFMAYAIFMTYLSLAFFDDNKITLGSLI
jgi:Golgi nucleoside diphosphatase